MLPKQKMAALSQKARQRGLKPADYARQLVEDGLEIQQEAENLTFAQIMGPVRKAAGRIDESEIVELVDRARRDRRRTARRSKQR